MQLIIQLQNDSLCYLLFPANIFSSTKVGRVFLAVATKIFHTSQWTIKLFKHYPPLPPQKKHNENIIKTGMKNSV